MTRTTHLPLVTIPRGIRPDEVLAHTQALVDAGFDVIETPLNSPDWAQSVQPATRAFGDRALIGAGTVLCPEDVDLVVAVGSKLVVTPNMYAPAIRAATQAGPVTCIGCTIVTEAFTALDADAQAPKISPAGAFGPDYVCALKAVLPAEVPMFAVGDITPENLADYLAAGCTSAGLGSDLHRPGQSAERTVERARVFVTAYRSTQSDRI